jgi:hypothetical protein
MTPDRKMSIWNRGPDFLDTVKGLELAKQDDVSLLDPNNAARRCKGQNAWSSPRIAKKQRHTTECPTQEQFRKHQKKGKDSKKKPVNKKKTTMQTILPGASLPTGDVTLPCDIVDVKTAAKMFDYNPRQLLLDDVLRPKKNTAGVPQRCSTAPVTVTQGSTTRANDSSSCNTDDSQGN